MKSWIRSTKDLDPAVSIGRSSFHCFCNYRPRAFKLKRVRFLKRKFRKIQEGSKEGIITNLKPGSMEVHCTGTQKDPILAHSGSWWIGKKKALKLSEELATLKIALKFTEDVMNFQSYHTLEKWLLYLLRPLFGTSFEPQDLVNV
jgi:hypothetical protein